MAGLKINICFWYVDVSLVEEIIKHLVSGNYEPVFCQCKDPKTLEEKFRQGNIDLIIADYDLPDNLRHTIESIHSRVAFHIPLIYIVGEKNELKAADTLKRGAWDYLLKSQLVKLVPTVYSSQKYGKVLKHSRKMETDLEESETKYRSIFNTVKDGMILIEAEELRIIDVNQSIYELFAFDLTMSKDEVIEQLAILTKQYCQDDLSLLVDQLGERKSFSYECLNGKYDGKIFWSENTMSRLIEGETTNYILVIRDIQERKMMEESLKESREHFKNLAENSPDVIMRFDREYKHLYVNETVEETTKIPADAFINKTHEEMGAFPRDMIEFWEKAIETVFRTNMKHTVEFDLPAGDETVTFEWRLFPEYDKDGKTETVLAIARNITESKLSQEIIRQSEERLKFAVEATSLGYWDWNLENDEVYFSPIYSKMLGYEVDELPQKLDTWQNLLHEDDREVSIQTVNKTIQNQDEAFEIDFRLCCKDGSYKWIRSRGSAVQISEEGKTLRLSGTHEDISQRKRNDQIQSVLFDISNAVNTTKNLDELYEKIREYLGEIVDTTNCFLALYNHESNMLSMPFHRDEVDSFTEFPAGKTLTGYVLKTGKAQLIDAKREKELTKKGHVEAFGSPCESWLGVPLKIDNKIIGVFVVQSYNKDIVYTQEDVGILEFVSDQIALAIERKRDQDNVQESQEKQRRIFESSPDPIIVVDAKGNVIDYNTTLLTALHVTNEPVMGQNIFHFIGREHWRNALRNFKKTWDEGYVKNLEFTINRADGSFFESEVSSGAIYNTEGKPESMVIIFKDISERKEAERTLREAKEKAEESDRLKTAFLSNMSHEIRTPMNAIVGFSDLLNNEHLKPGERAEFIAQINMGADNLMHLIDDIIDISKIEAGQIKVNMTECYLKSLLDEQMIMYRQHLERIDKTHIELKLHWGFDNEEVVIQSDPFRVKQIVTNLMNNALKFTEEGSVELGVTQDAEMVKIFVKDTGIGIDPEKQSIIFDRFMQGHKSKSRLYGGTGLGLAISKNLTDLLGGEIGVESAPGEGSMFWFTLPKDHIEVMKKIEIPVDKNLDYNWKGKKILVAEDEPSNFQLISEVLKPTEVQIIWAKDGNETMELFGKHGDQLNLILMDIQMPEKNGYECTRMIKDVFPDIPVIAQTAYAMAGEKEMSIEAGCDDYIRKPIQVSQLIQTLGAYLK